MVNRSIFSNPRFAEATRRERERARAIQEGRQPAREEADIKAAQTELCWIAVLDAASACLAHALGNMSREEMIERGIAARARAVRNGMSDTEFTRELETCRKWLAG